MSVDAITSTGAGSQASASLRVPVQTLGQDDFFKLLVTQMTSQDPLNPQKDTEFIAQMAQFNSLEQMKGVQSGVALLRQDQQLLQATALLGQTVVINADQNQTVQGVVSAVQIEAGTPKLIVGGKPFDLSQVAGISPTATPNPNP